MKKSIIVGACVLLMVAMGAHAVKIKCDVVHGTYEKKGIVLEFAPNRSASEVINFGSSHSITLSGSYEEDFSSKSISPMLDVTAYSEVYWQGPPKSKIQVKTMVNQTEQGKTFLQISDQSGLYGYLQRFSHQIWPSQVMCLTLFSSHLIKDETVKMLNTMVYEAKANPDIVEFNWQECDCKPAPKSAATSSEELIAYVSNIAAYLYGYEGHKEDAYAKAMNDFAAHIQGRKFSYYDKRECGAGEMCTHHRTFCNDGHGLKISVTGKDYFIDRFLGTSQKNTK